MGKTGVLGAFEEVVLLAVHRASGEAYSVSVRRDISERSGSEVTMGAIHSTLDRLERKGLIETQASNSTETRGRGRPRRCYRILPKGSTALAETQRIRKAMWEGVQLPSET